MAAKTISIDDLIADQLKDPEFKAGFEAESEKLESAVQLMLAREAAGLSQRDLAAKSGVPQSTIARVERGSNTSVDTLNKLAHALGKKLEVRFA
ncbi:XRE family transcriptional regulator [Weissella cibaria]|uniref:helix-turn-helix domain-containing protein n=1 Tax=Weissella cibaria TaxID=137591 RepID=UPI00223B1022|nr:helix-turn-helix transcriptional regulator [Weissella cibaria]MCT0010975.1 XRE family transcriptional regulator [Weissella cibaria]MCT0950106.1 XRE family transcriptional regulator [Weissella cibaria]MCT0953671.1 XRE family transcriptional regulator [Weissella cibaria]